MTTLQSPANFDPALGKALKFNRDDLQANRVGGITDRQKTAMYGTILTNFTRFGLIVGAAVIVSLLLLAAGNSTLALALLVLIGIGAVISFPTLLYTWKLRQDWQQAKVATVSGQVNITGDQLQIGDQTFKVNQEAVKNFKTDEVYMLYYAPYSKWILAVETVKNNG